MGGIGGWGLGIGKAASDELASFERGILLVLRKTEEAGAGVKLSEGHSIYPHRHYLPQIWRLSPVPLSTGRLAESMRLRAQFEGLGERTR